MRSAHFCLDQIFCVSFAAQFFFAIPFIYLVSCTILHSCVCVFIVRDLYWVDLSAPLICIIATALEPYTGSESRLVPSWNLLSSPAYYCEANSRWISSKSRMVDPHKITCLECASRLRSVKEALLLHDGLACFVWLASASLSDVMEDTQTSACLTLVHDKRGAILSGHAVFVAIIGETVQGSVVFWEVTLGLFWRWVKLSCGT